MSRHECDCGSVYTSVAAVEACQINEHGRGPGHGFRELVRQMRDAQIEYFRTRSKEALLRSKSLEKLVDEKLSGQRRLTE